MTQPAAGDQVPLQQFTGTLRGGILAIGAETTGWVLETADGKRIDVNVAEASDAAEKLEGKRVVIHGAISKVSWPERGPRDLLIARRIEPTGE